MRLFGFELGRRSRPRETPVRRAINGQLVERRARMLLPVGSGGSWVSIFQSRPPGWFQLGERGKAELSHDRVMAQSTVFACHTLVARDIGKLRPQLVEKTPDGIWVEVDSAAFSPVLRKPNRYQTWQKFVEQWMVSKLGHGNAYMLKQRDGRGVVTALYPLDPTRVQVLVAESGDVFYQLMDDNLSGITETMFAVPASEIIHDRAVCLFHPLVGVSPLFAACLAATQALRIQTNSAKFFENMSQPGGILSAPGQIGDDTAKRLKEHWEREYSGDKVGKVAVLGDSLKYEAMATNPIDAQLVEQLGLSAEQIAAVYHVPAYMVGAAPVPANANVEAEQLRYFSQCLQADIVSIQLLAAEGLGLGNVPARTLGILLDLDDLLRMDTASLTTALGEQMKAGLLKPNEGRKRLNLGRVKGGDTPYLQQQNFSLAALAKRDAADDPFKTASPAPAPPPAGNAPPAAPAPDAPPPKAFLELMERIGQVQAELTGSIEKVREAAAADPSAPAIESMSSTVAKSEEALRQMTDAVQQLRERTELEAEARAAAAEEARQARELEEAATVQAREFAAALMARFDAAELEDDVA